MLFANHLTNLNKSENKPSEFNQNQFKYNSKNIQYIAQLI